MKSLFTISFILISLSGFGQKKDSVIIIKPTQVQIEILLAKDKTLQEIMEIVGIDNYGELD